MPVWVGVYIHTHVWEGVFLCLCVYIYMLSMLGRGHTTYIYTCVHIKAIGEVQGSAEKLVQKYAYLITHILTCIHIQVILYIYIYIYIHIQAIGDVKGSAEKLPSMADRDVSSFFHEETTVDR
jgi:hypothetical protein